MSQIYDQYGLAAFGDVMSGKMTPEDMIEFKKQDPEGFDRLMKELQAKKQGQNSVTETDTEPKVDGRSN